MLFFTKRIAQQTRFDFSIELDFATRQKSRFRAQLDNGEAIGIDLPRTGVLEDGACLTNQHNQVLRIVASKEPLMQVRHDDAFTLMKAAYHLGNRHVPLMLTPQALFFEPDHVLKDMLVAMGLEVTQVEVAFNPETGAYQGHSHSHGHSHNGHEH